MALVICSAASPRTPRNRLDRLAIALSALCLAHCLASAIVLALFASFAGPLLDDRIHEIGLGVAVILGAVALGRGLRRHGRRLPLVVGSVGLVLMALDILLPHGPGEVAATIVGVSLLALGHWLNQRAVRR
ncbi:MerC domain-containing protein [Sphingomonas sp.]|uniref:MerC domain-containing protein n=1 Tax=Sphingomonas sp. TaxID=28214 RepID=UPI002C609017|nr:MerC domain-containing protein [Sphingomonas sp.]HTG37481.1 MerC domain-containing protein [Sphingomonas sp.]